MVLCTLVYLRAAVDSFIQHDAGKLMGKRQLGHGKTDVRGGFHLFGKSVGGADYKAQLRCAGQKLFLKKRRKLSGGILPSLNAHGENAAARRDILKYSLTLGVKRCFYLRRGGRGGKLCLFETNFRDRMAAAETFSVLFTGGLPVVLGKSSYCYNTDFYYVNLPNFIKCMLIYEKLRDRGGHIGARCEQSQLTKSPHRQTFCFSALSFPFNIFRFFRVLRVLFPKKEP